LVSIIKKNFTILFPEQTIHPTDILTTLNSPYPRKKASFVKIGIRLIKHLIIKHILGREARMFRFKPPHVAVLAFTLKRRVV
ncbi:hypothetical protein C6A37_08030, partial [Desulfobacteraceae bacterium SEEP-SAG9]